MSGKKIESIGNVIIDRSFYKGEDLYSEGASEDRILDFVRTHTSLEYERYIQESKSWSVMYHLSHIRENVVGWLPIKDTESVLEIGSGCGAVTGMFARLAGEVTCIELSEKRSLINAYRNREYDNISIMVGNFEDIEPNLTKKYDYITLIGVLEYAQSYISGDRPFNRMLSMLKDHLTDDGKIIIAIENRLGLKYFAGCREDHLGKYFGGIVGYKTEDGVRTFSKEALERLLDEEGLSERRFYYPYPDYKLAHTIYSDDFLPGPGELNTNIRNYDSDRLVLFDETKAFDSMIEEGRFPEFANSFVVVASPSKLLQQDNGFPVFARFSNERTEEFRICTIIGKTDSGELKVHKSALSAHANAHIDRMYESSRTLRQQYANTGIVPAACELIKGRERGTVFAGTVSKARDSVSFEYISGITLEDYLNELEAAGLYTRMEAVILEYCSRVGSCSDISEFRRTTGFDEIFGKRDFKKKYMAVNPCNYDMIFSNIVIGNDEKEQGVWTVLDYEWMLTFPVPIKFVIYRALFYHFRGREDDGFVLYLARKGLDVFSLCGIDIGERMLFAEMEHAFQIYIIGGEASLEVLRIMMPTSTMMIDHIVKLGSYLKNLDTPKVYFSRGNNFTSENQIGVTGKVSEGHVSMVIPFERFINSLRIDPTEYPCLISIETLTYTLDNGMRQDVTEIIANGYKLSERTFLFDTNDAQIIIEKVVQNARSIEVRYQVSMMESPFYDNVIELLQKRKEENEALRRSFKYRLKRKLGIIKEDVLPEGYVKAYPAG
ncbi:MAG: class I SAM-dependent methyltransferase [Lachnospiraceae bacterium]|nr:class I SAM-dependent methyltransferase [Lachnospiraceae bacterium]